MNTPTTPSLTRLNQFLLPILLAVLSAHHARAEDAYLNIPCASLNLTEGKFPEENPPATYNWRNTGQLHAYVALDREGEAYLVGESVAPWRINQRASLVIRAPQGQEVCGQLFVPKPDMTGMTALKFKIDASSVKGHEKELFCKGKETWFRGLRERNIPGGAWFRRQETEAAKAHNGKPSDVPAFPRTFSRRQMGEDGYDETFELFSGGRAVSENLQLDRLMAPAASNAATVDISSLKGVTIKEMDWKPLIQDSKPAKDALAAYIPFDQHALFFPTFEALTRWIDEADSDGTPILQMFESRSEDANSRANYQRQLCLELNDLSRMFGPAVIASAAVTGSDPYLRTGTDFAVLYEGKTPEILASFIQAKHKAAQQNNSEVKAISGNIDGVRYSGVASADRKICSYMIQLGDVVIVCNSTNQLASLIAVSKGTTPALASQDEYSFFRTRYPAGAQDETAFLVLSDATIRRWCGPKWRIGNARRTRVAAELADLQAAHMTELGSAAVKPCPIECALPEAGDVQLTVSGVISSTCGTLDFMTPIAEMPLTKVTQGEADAYNRWCQGYERNWNQFFDPIAIRFAMGPKELRAEVTVMPLITGTEYREVMPLTIGAKIPPEAGDRHPEALVHLAFALNPASKPIAEAGNFIGNFAPSLKVNPLGWLGQCISLYADQDLFWQSLAEAGKPENFFEQNYPRLPLALHCEVKNPLGLATFLASLRAFVEQTAPKMTTWENLEYNGQAFVKVSSPGMGDEGGPTNLFVYYATTPKSLTVTLNEDVLKRALDRQQHQQQPKAESAGGGFKPIPWLGTNLCLQVDRGFVPIIQILCRDEYQSHQQELCWNNLPILNEWKRLFPDQDPVKVHEKFWQTRLLCPGGGSYVWNEKWHTMESTVYGHPGEPKPGPKGIPLLAKFASANFGLSFENDGLSAKIALERGQNNP